MIDKDIGTCIISDTDISNLYLIEKTLNRNIINSKLDMASDEHNIKFSNNFKLILYNYIECINNGANILLYKYKKEDLYYYEIHKRTLKDKYDIELYQLNNCPYKKLKKINNKLNLFVYIYYFIISKLMECFIKKINIYVSNNIGFEINNGSFERIKKSMINKFLTIDNQISLIREYYYYKKKFMLIPLDKPKNCLKVILIGEYLTYFIETKLADKNIQLYKLDNNYSNRFLEKYYFFRLKKYLKYKLKINQLYILNKVKSILKTCDGVIYIRDFYNSQEVAFLKILEKICKDNKKTLFFINIDEKTTNDTIISKLDVFKDMITIKTY